MTLYHAVKHHQLSNCISDVIVSLLTLSVVDHGFKPQSDQVKDYKIGICCFSAKHAVIRSTVKDLNGTESEYVYPWIVVSGC